MNFQQRQQSYKSAIAARDELSATRIKSSDAFGVSNSAKFVEGGLFAFNVNFEQFPPDVDQLLIHCLLRFPPEDEILFSIVIRSELPTFRRRLEEMRTAGATPATGAESAELDAEDEAAGTSGPRLNSGSPTSAANNKNVKGYIAADGRLYLRNKSYWDAIPADIASMVTPVIIDSVYFTMWPPAASARRSLLAREFIGYIGGSVGRERVHELRIWTDAQAVSASMQRMPSLIAVADIERDINLLGGHYPGGEVRQIHAALNFLPHKHFVILSGLSGTGKTQLAIQYARAVHGLTYDERDPFLIVCPVRPEWTDPAGLTGYFDVLSNRYVVPPFLEAVLLATAHPYSPVFVVLDELNLARVEYYLSDVLSCIETGEVLRLHTSGVPLEGSTGTSIPAEIPLPHNLFLIGTINVDETTNPISDKVLDRAMVIDMSRVDLDGFVSGRLAQSPSLAASVAACSAQLVAIHTLMSSHGLGFGYRVAEEVIRYHAFVAEKMPLSAGSVMDDLLVQKILVKLRGSERQRPLLSALRSAAAGLPRAQSFLARLQSDLDEFGSFQASK